MKFERDGIKKYMLLSLDHSVKRAIEKIQKDRPTWTSKVYSFNFGQVAIT